MLTIGGSMPFGRLRQDGVDLVAHVLRRDVACSFSSLNPDDDLRDALARRRAELVDAADGVDRALDLVGDVGLDLLRRSAVEARRDDDEREVDVRELIEAEPR